VIDLAGIEKRSSRSIRTYETLVRGDDLSYFHQWRQVILVGYLEASG
jgi:hypothetical protein